MTDATARLSVRPDVKGLKLSADMVLPLDGLAVRLYLAEAELRAAQRHHDGSPMACARYRAALQEWKAAETEASRLLRTLMECPRPSEA
jgi:hypothetical protein